MYFCFNSRSYCMRFRIDRCQVSSLSHSIFFYPKISFFSPKRSIKVRYKASNVSASIGCFLVPKVHDRTDFGFIRLVIQLQLRKNNCGIKINKSWGSLSCSCHTVTRTLRAIVTSIFWKFYKTNTVI